ncbi:hypothetical protein [Kineococcus sp. R86509]|uniref:hypothetical protein n=1 Tax=Kineococcus sp. R86509 TaxID=3093851 RepID=UPI0036D2AD25
MPSPSGRRRLPLWVWAVLAFVAYYAFAAFAGYYRWPWWVRGVGLAACIAGFALLARHRRSRAD